MSEQKTGNELLQWHSAFFAGMQIELEEEADQLTFENEHQLGTKPLGIDILIIKKNDEIPIKKNIGCIFRKHNIIEYKSPDDYLSIDDFYKVYGYCCFYKADTVRVDSIQAEDITMTLVCSKYPRKLIHHLRRKRHYKVECTESGVYYVIGDFMPIQILLTRDLSEEENLWLKNLTDQITEKDLARKLLESYKKHDKNPLYKSVMNIIVRANQEIFKEVSDVCEALEELMKDKIEEKARKLAEERAEKIAEERAEKIAEERAEKLVEERAEKLAEKRVKLAEESGTKRVNDLIVRLFELGRSEEIITAAGDKAYQMQLFAEFGL